ncbi:MAG: DUF4012 domain-containing protein [Bifidobacterium sp.]|uniref:DUF4012 domain-containing protein n=1 Tax=Bifidobacterium sp. TaxID=41200 RepID=UPI0039E83D80
MSEASQGSSSKRSGKYQNPSGQGYGHHSNQPIPKHTGRKIGIALSIILLVLIIIGVVGGYLGMKLYRQAMEVKSEEEQAISLISSVQDISQLKDKDAVSKIIPELQKHTSKAASITDGSLWKLASKAPVYGDDITTVRGMTHAVDSLASDTLPQLSKTLQTMLGAKLSTGDKQINIQPIVNAQSGFNAANDSIKSELKTLQSLPEPHLKQIKSPYNMAVEKFTSVSEKIDKINNLIQVMPKFLGSGGARNYVIVAQTTSEARSSGGLIGSLGSFSADDGLIKVGDFHPNSEFLNIGGSHANAEEESVFSSPLDFAFDIRDLATFPDFSRTADTVKSVWQESQYNSTVDGVMAIDPVFVQEMIKLSGDVTLPTGQTLTGNNTAAFLLNGIYKDVPVSQQNAYFGYVATAAMNNVFENMTASKMIKMAQSFTTLAGQRHLYLYSFHSDDAKHFQDAGLAKSSPSSETDPEIGIYLNENNPSKMDWYIHRKTVITRSSCNADGSQSYRVTFTATNTIPAADLASGNAYILGGSGNIGAPGTAVERMLFYGPAGGSLSNLTVSSGNGGTPKQVSMDGKTPWTTVATIAPNKSVTYSYDVTTSKKSTSDLKLDQTPMGWTDEGVTYDTKACVVR